MTILNWALVWLCFISFVLFVPTAIANLVAKKYLRASVNFAYGIITLVTSIVILVTQNSAFLAYYIVAFGLAFAAMAYNDYKEESYKSAIIDVIGAFISIMSFAFSCFFAIIA